MFLYFHFENFGFEYSLPAINDRRIQLNLNEKLDSDVGSISLEVWDNIWYIHSNEEIDISANDKHVEELVLSDGLTINGSIKGRRISFAITVHALTKQYTHYEKFSLENNSTITIGGDESSDIVIQDSYTSKNHAVIKKKENRFYITDLSRNGTYISNTRISGECPLDIMDVVYITGVKIVFMGEFVAINRPDICSIKLPSYKLVPTVENIVESSKPLIRSPRVLEPLLEDAIEIESPPAPQNQKRQPAIFTIGPALTMPLPILAAILINTSQSGNFMMSTLVSVLLSALMAAGWAVANMIYTRRMAKKEEVFRQEAYRQYIEENRQEIIRRQNKNTFIIKGQHLSLAEVGSVLSHNTSVLWNRNVNQPDFMDVRIGTGSMRFQGDIVVSKQRFSLVKDPMQSEPHILKEQFEYIKNAISIVPLGKTKVIGVLGSARNVRQIAQAIALQASVLHAYTDVKLAFILRPGEDEYYEWAKPLPHLRWNDNKIRLFCTEETERQNVLFYLNGILRSRKESQESYNGDKPVLLPHLVIFCTDPDLIAGENINKYLADSEEYGVTFVLLYGMLDKLPNECNHIIQWDEDFQGFYALDKSINEGNKVQFDIMSSRQTAYLARKISGYYIRELATGEIPGSVSFLEMHNVRSIEKWDILKKWKENRAYESLRALIGIGSGGKPIYLDIHEKQHGPHGLVAGTTGSGKSETIQTYILSLAMTFHPHEVSFILIDYKGGGMANAFLELPHLAGTITNLDSTQVFRALVSIKAEIKHRQTLFNQFNVNHIDAYSRYFREGSATEALPHLIIISDEFAELKKEQPEFIKELVSTARVGRSLGVHLILATQKPSGVVDDEIWSNSRFKLCLRVQDKQDSSEMLHRPDAAYLTHVGRGYMQIGNDEIFELFQSGYSGSYYDSDLTEAPENNEVTMIGLDGSPLMLDKKEIVFDNENRETQLSACVSYIRSVANANEIDNVRPLWMPPLEVGITLDDIYKGYKVPKEDGVYAVIGLIDNPYNQTQQGAILPFSKLSHLLIAGMPGTGKSTMLQTILYSLVSRYTAEQVIFYCLDFSSNLTKVFERLPHCGGVVGPDDPERTSRLFQLMDQFISERTGLFNRSMVGSFEEYNVVSDKPIPEILLILDNIYAFDEAYPDMADEKILLLLHQGAKYGIHLVVTTNHINDVKYKLRQNFDVVLPLTLAERGDYHEALGVMPQFTPSNQKGRGLWGEDALEYQTALAVKGDNEKVRADNMLQKFSELPESTNRAPGIAYIPKDEEYKDFLAKNGQGDVLNLGYVVSDISIVTAPLMSTYCYAVSGSNRRAVENMMDNFVYAATALGARKQGVFLKYEPGEDQDFDVVYRNGEDIFELLKQLKEEFSKRSALKRESGKLGKELFDEIVEAYGKLFIFIDSMNDFLNCIYEEREESYNPIVELFFKQGKGLGIYFIAGFESSVYGTNMYKDAYQIFVEHGTGIHLGGRLDQQKLIDIPGFSTEIIKPKDISEGVVQIDDQIVKVFIPKNKIQ